MSLYSQVQIMNGKIEQHIKLKIERLINEEKTLEKNIKSLASSYIIIESAIEELLLQTNASKEIVKNNKGIGSFKK